MAGEVIDKARRRPKKKAKKTSKNRGAHDNYFIDENNKNDRIADNFELSGGKLKKKPDKDNRKNIKVARPTVPEDLDEKNLKKPFENKAVDKPRWAEKFRGTEQITMFLPVQLIRKMDEHATDLSLTRNDWFIGLTERWLREKAGTNPPYVPESDGDTKFVKFRVRPELKKRIKDETRQHGINITEWVRRLSVLDLSKATAAPATKAEI